MSPADQESSQAFEAPAAVTLAEARRLLIETHKVAVGDDDPLLMTVTLHQAFIADYEAMLHRHNDQLGREVGSIVTKAAGQISESANVLRDDLLNEAVKKVIAAVSHQAESAGLIKHHMRSQLKAMAILTAVSVLSAALSITALFLIIK